MKMLLGKLSFRRIPTISHCIEDDDCRRRTSVGGMCTKTKKETGYWCPHCFRKGHFQWILSGHCELCGRTSNKNNHEVKQIMVGR